MKNETADEHRQTQINCKGGDNKLNKSIETNGGKPADGAREEYEDEGAGELANYE